MKKTFLITAFFSISNVGVAVADDQPSTLWRYGGLVLGAGSALLFHEVGHAIAASAVNADSEWHWVYMDIRESSDRDFRIIAVSGFTAEIVSSELLLTAPFIKKDSPFVIGWIAWTIINPLSYAIQHQLFGSGDGDIYEFKRAGGNAEALGFIITTHAMLNLIRLWKNSDFQTFLQPARGGGTLTVGVRW